MSDEIYGKLSEPFPEAVLRQNPKGMTYVPVSEVHARLNNALGVGNWSYEVIDTMPQGKVETTTGDYPKAVVAHVRISLNIPTESNEFNIVRRDGFGGQEVQFLKNGNGPVDIGDAYKGAVSDALKKAAQSAGVGLDIARTEEALEAEQEAREADEPKAEGEILDKIKEAYGQLNDDAKKEFNKFWGKRGKGKKFSSGRVTVVEAEAALAELNLMLDTGVA